MNTNNLHKRRFWLSLTVLTLLASTLTGCTVLEQIQLPWVQPSVELTQPNIPAENQTPQPTQAEGLPTETVEPTPTELTVWLPPEMNPEEETQAAVLLRSRLDAFAQSQGIEIKLRLKAMSGASGMLDSLTAASVAAPDALPDLLVLNRRDLETAALKSLIVPLDELTTIVDGPDWYPFATEMSLIQSVVYGIPFVGDPLAFVYNRSQAVQPLPDWAGISTDGVTFAFPAEDPQATFPLTLYLAMGGAVMDSQRRPMLDEKPLTDTLTLLQQAKNLGRIHPDVFQLQNSLQTWELFAEGDVDSVVVPARVLLSNLGQVDEAAVIAPALNEVSLTTGNGWVWAVAARSPAQQRLAVALAENLVEPGFLAGWSEAFGQLPMRPSALKSWKDEQLRTALDSLAAVAKLTPGTEVLNSVAPALHDAVIAVLRDDADPKEAAQKAVESLK